MGRRQHTTERAAVLFIADVHLDASRLAITRLFLDFIAGPAREASALYILGDLFEAWIGDDAVDEDNAVVSGLRALTANGVPVAVMRGNRDFLLGRRFAQLTGVELLPDPTPITLDETPTLLTHGDILCVDDIAYQQTRRMVQDPEWQRRMLAMSIPERIAYAQRARGESNAHTDAAADAIMDANTAEAARLMSEYGARLLIHGHTHRPGRHALEVGGQPAERIVLGDWHDQGSMLRAHRGALTLEGL